MAENALDRVSTLPENWNFRRVCLKCKIIYSDRTSVGAWGCWYHPGAFNATARGNNFGRYRYDCCGQALLAGSDNFVVALKRGCTRCDHTILDRGWGPQDSVTLPIENMLDLRTYTESSHIDDLQGTITIDRCDVATAQHRIAYGVKLTPPPPDRRHARGRGYTLAQFEKHLKRARQDTWYAYEGEHYPVTEA